MQRREQFPLGTSLGLGMLGGCCCSSWKCTYRVMRHAVSVVKMPMPGSISSSHYPQYSGKSPTRPPAKPLCRQTFLMSCARRPPFSIYQGQSLYLQTQLPLRPCQSPCFHHRGPQAPPLALAGMQRLGAGLWDFPRQFRLNFRPPLLSLFRG